MPNPQSLQPNYHSKRHYSSSIGKPKTSPSPNATEPTPHFPITQRQALKVPLN